MIEHEKRIVVPINCLFPDRPVLEEQTRNRRAVDQLLNCASPILSWRN